MAISLSLKNLAQMPAGVARPKYEQKSITPGIVHIGVGNFHRAHLAVYLDDLFNMGLDHDWGIIGAGVMPADEKSREIFASQDYLTTVVEQDNDVSSARITSSMVGLHFAQ